VPPLAAQSCPYFTSWLTQVTKRHSRVAGESFPKKPQDEQTNRDEKPPHKG